MYKFPDLAPEHLDHKTLTSPWVGRFQQDWKRHKNATHARRTERFNAVLSYDRSILPMRFLFRIAEAVSTPEMTAPETPQVTMSWPVR